MYYSILEEGRAHTLLHKETSNDGRLLDFGSRTGIYLELTMWQHSLQLPGRHDNCVHGRWIIVTKTFFFAVR